MFKKDEEYFSVNQVYIRLCIGGTNQVKQEEKPFVETLYTVNE